MRQRLANLLDLSSRYVSAEDPEDGADGLSRINRPDVRKPAGDFLDEFLPGLEIGRLPCRFIEVIICAAHNERQLSSKVRSQLRLQPIPEFVEHCRENFPGQLPVGTDLIHDLVKPDVGGLDGLVEYVEAGCAHGEPPFWSGKAGAKPLAIIPSGRRVERLRQQRQGGVAGAGAGDEPHFLFKCDGPAVVSELDRVKLLVAALPCIITGMGKHRPAGSKAFQVRSDHDRHLGILHPVVCGNHRGGGETSVAVIEREKIFGPLMIHLDQRLHEQVPGFPDRAQESKPKVLGA